MAAAVPIHGSPAKWHASNTQNMQRAKGLIANMMKQVRLNEEVERASKDAAMEQTARAAQNTRNNVFAKAAAHGEVITTSSQCMREIEDGTLQTENSLAILKQNRALAFAALQVCKRRTQLRNRRPKTELVKDYVSIALNSEQKLLEAAREEFLQLEEEGKQLHTDLADKRLYLSADTGSRRLAMKQDQHLLRPHLAPPPDQQRPVPEVNQANSKGLLQDTFQLIERFHRHRERTIQAVARIKDDSREAVLRTESCLERRTDELTATGSVLKQHMNDAESAISVAERSLDKSTKRLDPTDSAKKEKLMHDRALLEQLKNHKATLHSEIQNKFIALEIDNMCRRVTPIKACEPNLLDAESPPSNRKSSLGGELRNSASAPNLLSTAGAGSVAGGGKLPSLGGTKMDSYSKDKFATASSKFSSDVSPSSTTWRSQ